MVGGTMFKWLQKKDVSDFEEKITQVGSKKILIVEDNELNATLMTDLLVAHGYNTRLVDEGNKVVALTRDFKPDLILMDIQLPDVSGLEVTQWIKDETDFKDIPIVAITAFAMKGDEKRMFNAGCKGYIPKPISVSFFLETISEVLRGKESSALIEYRAREKRNEYQRHYRRKNKKRISCFKLNNEQLELVASLRLEGRSAQEISDTTGLLDRFKIIREIHCMELTSRELRD